MPYHKILESQIRKFLPEKCLQDESVCNFLNVVSRCYATFEKDKNISEHAFDVSEKEYQDINSNLLKQNEIRKQSILKLKEAIKSMDPNASFILENDDDLFSTISFLEQQIKKSKELANELIKAKEFAEKAMTAKSDFLSVMSHEIRTPLNAIIGTILLLQYQDPLPSQKEFLRVLEISSENLLSLINDVLDFSKLEEGKIVFADRDVELLHFLNNIKMANQSKAEEKGNNIILKYDENIPDFVRGDDVRLGQILNNLVSNAVKFTKDGTITIETLLRENNADDVLIYFSVQDTGIGIPKDKQQIIFERFIQANTNITRDFGGSGLGLAIIKRLLELQGSEINLESEYGKGSNFYFVLRFRKSKINTIREEKIQTFDKQDLKGLKVLLVEDVLFNVMVADGMLQNWGAITETAENGAIAVEKMKENNYDIVLMDIQMPVMDGYDATTEIRKFDTATPIIALTASISPDIQQKVTNVGMNGFITKPFNPNDLYIALYENTINKSTKKILAG
ncbi:MAG: response regulator [Bacteroidota bacterium]|nr:response regulator [Bacteroidota bacterium]